VAVLFVLCCDVDRAWDALPTRPNNLIKACWREAITNILTVNQECDFDLTVLNENNSEAMDGCK
jgi:hypothetical protein